MIQHTYKPCTISLRIMKICLRQKFFRLLKDFCFFYSLFLMIIFKIPGFFKKENPGLFSYIKIGVRLCFFSGTSAWGSSILMDPDLLL